MQPALQYYLTYPRKVVERRHVLTRTELCLAQR